MKTNRKSTDKRMILLAPLIFSIFILFLIAENETKEKAIEPENSSPSPATLKRGEEGQKNLNQKLLSEAKPSLLEKKVNVQHRLIVRGDNGAGRNCFVNIRRKGKALPQDSYMADKNGFIDLRGIKQGTYSLSFDAPLTLDSSKHPSGYSFTINTKKSEDFVVFAHSDFPKNSR